MSHEKAEKNGFHEFGLSPQVLKSLNDSGFETPTPIQLKSIHEVMSGRDLIGQAQTGTGKTAAFALPLLTKLDLHKMKPQVLVLTPTRELAIQVAEAFQQFATHMPKFHVLPIYGGASMEGQLRQLKRGVHVVVGTPGRVMDHMRRGTLKLDGLTTLVLDEADEMLRMGFIDDVKWILEQSPDKRQLLLFSATMPPAIRSISKRYLNEPVEVTIKERTTTAATIRQRYCVASNSRKLDLLTRILDAEDFEGVLIFVRTKRGTVELAEKLQARGYTVEALNGDIAQRSRERTVEQLRAGKIDIIVATDVAARGLDVERISHVINFEMPCDAETYVHRIGRTGRAGRAGEAIIFVDPREKRILQLIERSTRQQITPMELPSIEAIHTRRMEQLKEQLLQVVSASPLEKESLFVEQLQLECNISPTKLMAAMVQMAQKNPVTFAGLLPSEPRHSSASDEFVERRPHRERDSFDKRGRGSFRSGDVATYRIEVGRMHNVQLGNIIGAICNETGLSNKDIGKVDLLDEHSTIDLPKNLSSELLHQLAELRIFGRKLNISLAEASVLSKKNAPRSPSYGKGAKAVYSPKTKKRSK